MSHQISSTSTSAGLGAIVVAMFDKMELDYGKKFIDQWGSLDPDALRNHWIAELTGYTPRELKRGIAAMEGSEWPPTLPMFKKMCRPPINDTAAYYEALAGLEARGKGEDGTWSHPAIYWTASSMRVDLMAQPYAQIKDRWATALSGQMNMGAWADIPPPRVLLAAAAPSATERERTEKLAKKLAAEVTKKAGDGIDHKRWAKRIIERIGRGDKTLSMIQINFAKEALGIDQPAQ